MRVVWLSWQPMTTATLYVGCCVVCCFMQLVRDVVSVSESTNWSQRSKVAARYHALRCDITPIDPTHQEYADIRDRVIESQDRYST